MRHKNKKLPFACSISEHAKQSGLSGIVYFGICAPVDLARFDSSISAMSDFGPAQGSAAGAGRARAKTDGAIGEARATKCWVAGASGPGRW